MNEHDLVWMSVRWKHDLILVKICGLTFLRRERWQGVTYTHTHTHTHTGTQIKRDACTFTHTRHDIMSALWHHQQRLLTSSCGPSFLVDCIGSFCSHESKGFFFVCLFFCFFFFKFHKKVFILKILDYTLKFTEIKIINSSQRQKKYARVIIFINL